MTGKLLAVLLFVALLLTPFLGGATYYDGLARPSLHMAYFMAAPNLPTFPEAKGHGAETFNACRSLDRKVQFVTSTAAGGDNTLDSAINNVDNTKWNIIIIKTGGVVDDFFSLTGSHDCTWVVGQTAPGGGIAIRSRTNAYTFNFDGAEEVRLSYLNLWRDTTGGNDNIWLESLAKGVFDHNSVFYTADEIISLTPTSAADSLIDISFQSNIIGFTFKVGFLVASDAGEKIDRITRYRNFSIDGRQRRPRLTTDVLSSADTVRLEMIEDVIHNHWSSRFGRIRGDVEVDYLSNFISQRTGASYDDIWQIVECDFPLGTPPCSGTDLRRSDQIYALGNVDRPGLKLGQWDMWEFYNREGVLADSVKRSGRLSATGWPATHDAYDATVTMDSAHAEFVISIAGNYRKLDADGHWSARRNALDDSAAARFTNATGRSADADSVGDYFPGGYPTLAAGTPPTDTDNDGMPDEFEDLCVGNATSMAPGGDLSGDGYLNIEEYLNGSNSRRVLAWDDMSTDEDGFIIRRDRGAGFAVLDTVAVPNATSYTDTDSRIGDRYQVVAYKGASNSQPSNIITSTCN